jgi:hypothetical protein
MIEVDKLLGAARSATGLDDFGDPWFKAPLSQVVRLLNSESRLVSDDALPVQIIIGYLADRLRLIDWLRQNPGALQEKVQVAGVIIGLPRGGSTLAQRLFGSSPQLTSTRRWELTSPLPFAGEKPGDPTPRIVNEQRALDTLAANWPEMASMHPMTPDTFDEEIQFFDRGFMSIMYFFYAYMPSYSQWEWSQNHSKIYAELLLWLQVLQYQEPARRKQKWLLKSPQHLLGGALREALRTFPDAKIIMTHRRLESVIASFASMQYQMTKGYTRDLDPKVLGPQAVELFERALHELLKIRAEQGAERFVDVVYDELVAEPLNQFTAVLQAMGLSVTEADTRAAADWMGKNGRDTHPRHKYTPEEFGIDRADLDRRFKFYLDTFLKCRGN